MQPHPMQYSYGLIYHVLFGIRYKPINDATIILIYSKTNYHYHTVLPLFYSFSSFIHIHLLHQTCAYCISCDFGMFLVVWKCLQTLYVYWLCFWQPGFVIRLSDLVQLNSQTVAQFFCYVFATHSVKSGTILNFLSTYLVSSKLIKIASILVLFQSHVYTGTHCFKSTLYSSSTISQMSAFSVTGYLKRVK